MREIKFRLRIDDKIVGCEKWYCGHQIEDDPCSAQPCWLYSKDGKNYSPNYIFHKQKDQFTGLYDKNGKEIYEGDIVNFQTSCDGKWHCGKVKWYPETASFYIFGKFGNWDSVDFGIRVIMKTIEVIGNIYENPELLGDNNA